MCPPRQLTEDDPMMVLPGLCLCCHIGDKFMTQAQHSGRGLRCRPRQLTEDDPMSVLPGLCLCCHIGDKFMT